MEDLAPFPLIFWLYDKECCLITKPSRGARSQREKNPLPATCDIMKKQDNSPYSSDFTTIISELGQKSLGNAKKNNTRAVADFLPDLVRSMGWEKQLALYRIFPRWKKLVSEDFARHSMPLKIEWNVLWLEVENSSWLQQLQYGKYELLDALNAFLGPGKLQDVRMVLPTQKDTSIYGEDTKETRLVYESPAPEKVAAFRKKLECIDDDRCREALMRYWYLSHACRVKED